MNRPVRLRFETGRLVPHTSGDELALQLFKQKLSEGQIIEGYFEVITADKSLGQLSRIHKIIRDIAVETGNTEAHVKREVKMVAGLYSVDKLGKKSPRSFADCSRDELSRAIFVAEEIGVDMGIPVP